MLRWIVAVWTAYAYRAASYQTRVLLTLVYLVVLGPATIVGRLLGARILELGDTSTTTARTTWIDRPTLDKSLAGLRRQF